MTAATSMHRNMAPRTQGNQIALLIRPAMTQPNDVMPMQSLVTKTDGTSSLPSKIRPALKVFPTRTDRKMEKPKFSE